MSETALAGAGHNNPPEPTPYELAVEKIDNVWLECKNWLDGGKVTNQAEADAIGNLLDLTRKAKKFAEDARDAETAELDQRIAEIRARYAPLIADNKTTRGKTVIAIATCKIALQPWLDAKTAEIAAAAKAAREKAEAAAEEARQAIQAAPVTDLEARAEAEVLVEVAQHTEMVAKAAEKKTAGAGGGFGRKVSLRSVWVAKMADMRAAARFYWVDRPVEMEMFLQGLADTDVYNGKRVIPGFEITEQSKVV